MNRTLFFWSIGLCFCLVLGLALGTATNEVSDQEQTQAALADTLPMPAVPHRIGNKVLRETHRTVRAETRARSGSCPERDFGILSVLPLGAAVGFVAL